MNNSNITLNACPELPEGKDSANDLPEQITENENLMKTEAHITPASPMLSNPPAEPGPAQSIYVISPTDKVEVHELADAFPEAEGPEFEQMKKSIEAEGQQVPIIMHGNMLLDGRLRLKAGQQLGIPVNAIQWQGTGTAEELILALNLRRRHFTTGQKAAVAVKLLPFFAQQAAKRMMAGTAAAPTAKLQKGSSNDLAAEQVGVSSRSVAKAKKIQDASLDIFHQLFTGVLTLAQAQKQINPPSPSQSQSPSGSLKIALMEIIKLVPDHNKEQFNKIVKECPTLKRALDSSADGESGNGDENEDGDAK
ncbi:MAG: ParB N-terminal domain-containing protein [Lentisphaerota bacterium]